MGAKPLAGFDGWLEMVRDPLVWLGYADPVISTEELRKDDPTRGEFGLRITALLKIFGTGKEKAFKAVDVLNKMQETDRTVSGPIARYPELFAAFANVKQTTSKSIGEQLRKDLNRMVNGYHIEFEPDSKHGNSYWLVGKTPDVPEKF